MRSNLTAATALVALAAFAVLPGCAVTRDQSTVGEYIDDTAITASVKAKFIEAKTVDAAAISVETLDGQVMLSGFAKSATEKSEAERIARAVRGVKSIKNAIVIREKQG